MKKETYKLKFDIGLKLKGHREAYSAETGDVLEIELDENNEVVKCSDWALYVYYWYNPGNFEKVVDRPDWREWYEQKRNMLYNPYAIREVKNNPILKQTERQLDAYLKILCYVEWANEGKEWGGRYTFIYNKKARKLEAKFVSVGEENTNIIELVDGGDAENMLTIPELVEALNEVFNVKK